MSIATITSKGQITIPKDIRLLYALETGDKISFVVNDGEVIFIPLKQSITTLKGIVSKPVKAVTVEAMNAAIKSKGAML